MHLLRRKGRAQHPTRLGCLLALGIACRHFIGGIFFTRLGAGVAAFRLDTFGHVIVGDGDAVAVAHRRFFASSGGELIVHVRRHGDEAVKDIGLAFFRRLRSLVIGRVPTFRVYWSNGHQRREEHRAAENGLD